MKLKTKDSDSTVTLSEEVFAYHFNEGLVHQAVVGYMNNARSGNSAQKTRSEVRGGGRKPWKQKGTGRARAGTIRSPLWRSGGVTFASKKRDYSQKLNKKMYVRAMRSIVSELIRTERLQVLSDFKCETHKTKEFLNKMLAMGVSNALIVTKEIDVDMYLAARNLVDFEVCDVESLNPVSLMRYETILITSDAIAALGERLL